MYNKIKAILEAAPVSEDLLIPNDFATLTQAILNEEYQQTHEALSNHLENPFDVEKYTAWFTTWFKEYFFSHLSHNKNPSNQLLANVYAVLSGQNTVKAADELQTERNNWGPFDKKSMEISTLKDPKSSQRVFPISLLEPMLAQTVVTGPEDLVSLLLGLSEEEIPALLENIQIHLDYPVKKAQPIQNTLDPTDEQHDYLDEPNNGLKLLEKLPEEFKNIPEPDTFEELRDENSNGSSPSNVDESEASHEESDLFATSVSTVSNPESFSPRILVETLADQIADQINTIGESKILVFLGSLFNFTMKHQEDEAAYFSFILYFGHMTSIKIVLDQYDEARLFELLMKKDESTMTIAEHLVRRGNTAVLKEVFSRLPHSKKMSLIKGSEKNRPSLAHWVVDSRNFEAFQFIKSLFKPEDDFLKLAIQPINEEKGTLWHWAAASGNPHIFYSVIMMEPLGTRYRRMSMTDESLHTVLHAAVESGNYLTVWLAFKVIPVVRRTEMIELLTEDGKSLVELAEEANNNPDPRILPLIQHVLENDGALPEDPINPSIDYETQPYLPQLSPAQKSKSQATSRSDGSSCYFFPRAKKTKPANKVSKDDKKEQFTKPLSKPKSNHEESFFFKENEDVNTKRNGTWLDQDQELLTGIKEIMPYKMIKHNEEADEKANSEKNSQSSFLS